MGAQISLEQDKERQENESMWIQKIKIYY
jgi:hypothetical protein